MPPFTKRAIVNSFLDIAAKKPFEKITVRDLVDRCGVNRNTFYYHFQDIYGVLEEVFLGDSPFFSAEVEPCEGLLSLLLFSEKERRAVQNMYVSLGSDGLSKYLLPSVRASLTAFMPQREGESASDCALRVRAMVYVTLGFYLDWLRGGCREEPEQVAERYRTVCQSLSCMP